MRCWALFLCVLSATRVCDGEVYTSSTHLKALLKAEVHLAATIERYVVAEKERLESLIQRAAEYRAHGERRATDAQKAAFVKHPVNVFVLIRRLTTDWQRVVSLMRNRSHHNAIRHLWEIEWSDEMVDVRFASEKDLEGAAKAVERLQSFYSLRAVDVAAGRIAGLPPADERMTGADCSYVGSLMYNASVMSAAFEWMGAAVELLEVDGAPPSAVAAALDHSIGALYELGRVRQALTLAHRLLQLDPRRQSALDNRAIFRDIVNMAEYADGSKASDERVPAPDEPASVHFNRARRRALCRGEIERDASVTSALHCRYKSDAPFLRLAPFKVELLNDAPLVAVFHDVLSPAEMAIVKQLAEPYLGRAQTSGEDDLSETSEKRTTQLSVGSIRLRTENLAPSSALLLRGSNETVARIRRRLALMTGLNMRSAEPMQVANYGVGGQYIIHPDYASPQSEEGIRQFRLDTMGNRIATVLFYLSEPEVGGHTIFPHLKLTLKPKLGSAAFWYNLGRDGEGLWNMWHSACPVLYGAKWVANSWIRQFGQEFRRPCPLDQADVYYTSADL